MKKQLAGVLTAAAVFSFSATSAFGAGRGCHFQDKTGFAILLIRLVFLGMRTKTGPAIFAAWAAMTKTGMASIIPMPIKMASVTIMRMGPAPTAA